MEIDVAACKKALEAEARVGGRLVVYEDSLMCEQLRSVDPSISGPWDLGLSSGYEEVLWGEQEYWRLSPPPVVSFMAHRIPAEEIKFSSAFESGNLFYAEKLDDRTFELELTFDPWQSRPPLVASSCGTGETTASGADGSAASVVGLSEAAEIGPVETDCRAPSPTCDAGGGTENNETKIAAGTSKAGKGVEDVAGEESSVLGTTIPAAAQKNIRPSAEVNHAAPIVLEVDDEDESDEDVEAGPEGVLAPDPDDGCPGGVVTTAPKTVPKQRSRHSAPHHAGWFYFAVFGGRDCAGRGVSLQIVNLTLNRKTLALLLNHQGGPLVWSSHHAQWSSQRSSIRNVAVTRTDPDRAREALWRQGLGAGDR